MCSKYFCLNQTVFLAHPINIKQWEAFEYEVGEYSETIHGALPTMRRVYSQIDHYLTIQEHPCFNGNLTSY